MKVGGEPRQLKQYGRVGQRRFGGRFFEEFLPALQGGRALRCTDRWRRTTR